MRVVDIVVSSTHRKTQHKKKTARHYKTDNPLSFCKRKRKERIPTSYCRCCSVMGVSLGLLVEGLGDEVRGLARGGHDGVVEDRLERAVIHAVKVLYVYKEKGK